MNSISVCEEEYVEFITVELPGVVVHSLYKPPPEPFLLPSLGQRIKPHIVIGDFNSHSTLWGYTTTDSDGEAVEQWADSNRVSLIHNAKLPKSFNSAIWKKGYNPDLISSLYLRTFRICVRSLYWIQPIPENYDRFIGLIRVVSRIHIPMGCRANYIPGLTEESQSLYEAYKKQYSSNPFAEGTLETGNKLIDIMKEEKEKRWEEVITSIDLSHNSCKAWQTIKKLSNDPTFQNPPCPVNTNQVAHHLLVNGQGTMPTKSKCPALPTLEGKPSLESAFSEEEYRNGIAALNNNKAAGIDDILVEQLNNLGPKAHKRLHTMLNTCFIEIKIPKIWRQSQIIAILKPGRDSAIPKNYRPISLLCHTYKLYER